MIKFSERVNNDLPLMGAYTEMPEAVYHAVKAFSYSGMKEFAKTPAHYKAYLAREHKLDPEREFFKAVHLLCLEPERHADIVVKDGTWAGALKKEVQELKAQGKIVVKSKDFEDAKSVASNLIKNQSIKHLLREGLNEVSIFWMENGVYCKARIDCLLPGEEISLVDLKSFGELHNERLIAWHVRDRMYHWQMAFYSMAINAVYNRLPTHRKWVFMEDKAPFTNKVRLCPEQLTLDGSIAIVELLKKYKACLEKDEWPGYEEVEAELMTNELQPVEF